MTLSSCILRIYMDNSFKNINCEKIYRTLIEIFAKQEGIKIENIIIEKEENNGKTRKSEKVQSIIVKN